MTSSLLGGVRRSLTAKLSPPRVAKRKPKRLQPIEQLDRFRRAKQPA